VFDGLFAFCLSSLWFAIICVFFAGVEYLLVHRHRGVFACPSLQPTRRHSAGSWEQLNPLSSIVFNVPPDNAIVLLKLKPKPERTR
jgi:hypothetical protein